MRRTLLAAATAVLLLLGVACGTGTTATTTMTAAEDGPLRVTATTTHAADLLRSVGGAHVEVTALMGPGIDPHLYRASPSDVRALVAADLVVHHGLRLEGRLAQILAGPALDRVHVLTDPMPTDRLLGLDGRPATASERQLADPHVWFDPELWLLAVDPVVAELTALAPERHEDFAAGAAAYAAEVRAADQHATDRLAAVPDHARLLVTSHDAFGYLGRAYDLEVIGVQGLSTDDEASIHDISSLATLLADRQVPALFTESSVSPASVTAVQEAAADRGWPLTVPATELYSDALGAVGTPAATYAGMLRANADVIAVALGAA